MHVPTKHKMLENAATMSKHLPHSPWSAATTAKSPRRIALWQWCLLMLYWEASTHLSSHLRLTVLRITPAHMEALATQLFPRGLSASVDGITEAPSAKVPLGHSRGTRIYICRSLSLTNVAQSRYSSSRERQMACCSTKDLFLKVSGKT